MRRGGRRLATSLRPRPTPFLRLRADNFKPAKSGARALWRLSRRPPVDDVNRPLRRIERMIAMSRDFSITMVEMTFS